jgi:uncharacterized protein (TIGR02186 family)
MRQAVLAFSLLWATMAAAAAQSTQLVADLSQHEIKISTGFSGTDLLLFGAADPSGDVVVVVSGPDGKTVVRKKERISGIWINADSVAFDSVPGFYHVSATSGLAGEKLGEVLSETGVGLRYQNLSPTTEMPPDRASEFSAALLRRKEARGLYVAEPGKIEFVGGTLFRAEVSFPATVPTGEYRVDVYHVKDEWVQSVTTIPLKVGKVGLEEAIYRFAQDEPALYGLVAILVAALSGYGAGMLFGRR